MRVGHSRHGEGRVTWRHQLQTRAPPNRPRPRGPSRATPGLESRTPHPLACSHHGVRILALPSPQGWCELCPILSPFSPFNTHYGNFDEHHEVESNTEGEKIIKILAVWGARVRVGHSRHGEGRVTWRHQLQTRAPPNRPRPRGPSRATPGLESRTPHQLACSHHGVRISRTAVTSRVVRACPILSPFYPHNTHYGNFDEHHEVESNTEGEQNIKILAVWGARVRVGHSRHGEGRVTWRHQLQTRAPPNRPRPRGPSGATPGLESRTPLQLAGSHHGVNFSHCRHLKGGASLPILSPFYPHNTHYGNFDEHHEVESNTEGEKIEKFLAVWGARVRVGHSRHGEGRVTWRHQLQTRAPPNRPRPRGPSRATPGLESRTPHPLACSHHGVRILALPSPPGWCESAHSLPILPSQHACMEILTNTMKLNPTLRVRQI